MTVTTNIEPMGINWGFYHFSFESRLAAQNGKKMYCSKELFRDPGRWLVSKHVPHGNPDVLGLHGVVEELLALALLRIAPVPPLAVAHPRPLHVLRRCVLHKPRAQGSGGGARGGVGGVEPERVDVLMLGQVLGDVVAVARQDVHHTARQVRRVEDLWEMKGRMNEYDWIF
jgi:hypothetical protein